MRLEKIHKVAVAFAIILGFDLLKFFALPGQTLVNWRLWPHWVWVLLALGLLVLSAIFKSRALFRFNIWIYSGVALLAAANHYWLFSATLTYNCFLFNLILVAVYFLALGDENTS